MFIKLFRKDLNNKLKKLFKSKKTKAALLVGLIALIATRRKENTDVPEHS